MVPCVGELSGHYVCKNSVTQGPDFSVLVLNQGGRKGEGEELWEGWGKKVQRK